jgi:myo-inositol-1(or 4)-monophosphatase
VDSIQLQTAIEIVIRAGEIQMSRFRHDVQICKKGVIDLVTQVDVEVETMCRALISERFPSHRVIAEELPNKKGTSTSDSEHVWIFDPIDGTVNFAHGLPIFCSSLALEINGKVELGVIFDPNLEELFVAEKGCGVRLNGKPLSVSSTPVLIDAMLCTGFPYDVHDKADELIGLFGAFISRARAVRRLGSAALDLCYVAAGRFDGFWERSLKPWDTAAGALMVEEAGGCVTDMSERPFTCHAGDVLASNGSLHEEMVNVIQGYSVNR